MDQLANQIKNLVYYVTLHPGSTEELWVRLLLGMLVGAGTLNLMAQLFRMSFPNFTASFFVLVTGGMLLFLLVSFAHMYLIRFQHFSGVRRSDFTLAMFVIVSLLVVIPMIKSTWCGNLFGATISWGVTVSVFLLTCVAVGEVFQVTETGREFASRQRDRSLGYEKVVEQNQHITFGK